MKPCLALAQPHPRKAIINQQHATLAWMHTAGCYRANVRSLPPLLPAIYACDPPMSWRLATAAATTEQRKQQQEEKKTESHLASGSVLAAGTENMAHFGSGYVLDSLAPFGWC